METNLSLIALIVTAILTAVIHTISGPDHYLPFIAIARSRHYGFGKTFFWTFLCGLGHIGSALLLAVAAVFLTKIIAASRLEWLEAIRGDIAAYAMIGMGGAMLIYALQNRLRHHPHKHMHIQMDGTVVEHVHSAENTHEEHTRSLSYWIVFIIFVFGPCEAMLPLLTASAALGTSAVIIVSIVFSIATILMMLCMVGAGLAGLKMLKMPWLENYASEIAGATVMLCGAAIVLLGL